MCHACNPSYSFRTLTPNPAACAAECANVSFGVQYVNTSSTDTGECIFSWLVIRTTNGAQESFAGEMLLSCPQVHHEKFYCGPSKNCAGFELIFSCTEE